MEPNKQNNNEVISIDFSCVNCGKVFVVLGKPKLYCSQRCQQDASLIRYVRACMKDGRIKEPSVLEKIKIKFAFAYSENGYYDAKTRKLSSILRSTVIERDNGLCRKCGAMGDEIDHIYGSSNDLSNLQLLCQDCHGEKTKANMIEITPGHERYEEIQARQNSLRSRIDALEPQRICDDEVNWNKTHCQIMKEQRLLLKQIKEDVEGLVKNRDQYEEQQVAQELNSLSEIRSQIEHLEIQKQVRIDEILTPEIRTQIEAIETEFLGHIEGLRKSASILEQLIKERVKQYGSTIKGSNLQAVWRKGAERWDTMSIEEYSKTHPEILQFRKEGKESVIIISVKKK